MVLWSIQDHISTSAGSGGSITKQNSKPGEGNDKTADGPSVGPRGVYIGHEDTVEDVAFCPSRYNLHDLCKMHFQECFVISLRICYFKFHVSC